MIESERDRKSRQSGQVQASPPTIHSNLEASAFLLSEKQRKNSLYKRRPVRCRSTRQATLTCASPPMRTIPKLKDADRFDVRGLSQPGLPDCGVIMPAPAGRALQYERTKKLRSRPERGASRISEEDARRTLQSSRAHCARAKLGAMRGEAPRKKHVHNEEDSMLNKSHNAAGCRQMQNVKSEPGTKRQDETRK